MTRTTSSDFQNAYKNIMNLKQAPTQDDMLDVSSSLETFHSFFLSFAHIGARDAFILPCPWWRWRILLQLLPPYPLISDVIELSL
jgi:hypothetical protein